MLRFCDMRERAGRWNPNWERSDRYPTVYRGSGKRSGHSPKRSQQRRNPPYTGWRHRQLMKGIRKEVRLSEKIILNYSRNSI